MKRILFVLFIFLFIGCDMPMNEIDIKNNSKYIITSVKYRRTYYYYYLKDIKDLDAYFDQYGYKDTIKYNVGDTIIIKIAKL